LEADLDDLVYGGGDGNEDISNNVVLPNNVMNHLPELVSRKQGSKIEHEINIVESEEVIKYDRILIVDDEPYNIDSLKVIAQCATFD